MSNKLKDLQITKVDFVDAGANQRANIMLFKRNAPKGGETVSTENPVKKFLSSIAKALGITEDEAQNGIVSIAKEGATTFSEEMAAANVREIMDEIWTMTDAYRTSLFSIMRDTDIADKQALMIQSTEEFCNAVKECAAKWAAGQTSQVAKSIEPYDLSDEEVEMAKSRLEAMVEKAAASKEVKPDETDKNGDPKTTPKKVDNKGVKPNVKKEGVEDMEINKSLLTDAEKAFLEAIEKKAGVQKEQTGDPATDDVAKAATETKSEAAEQPKATDDVLKGQTAVVDSLVKSLQSKVDELETRELNEIAKKYEVVGQKPEDLVPLLKSLKGDHEQYNRLIAALDSAAAASEKAFTEIGKRGSVSETGADAAWAKIEKKAEELRKAEPTLSYYEACDKACEQNPDLVHEYEAGEQ